MKSPVGEAQTSAVEPSEPAGRSSTCRPDGCDGVGSLSDGGDLSDHQLLREVEAAQRAINKADAVRLSRILEFHDRRECDYQARRAEDPHFTLTPLAETALEVAPLVGATEGRVKDDVRVARSLKENFPDVWDLVASGQLDVYRARIVSDAAERHLHDPGKVAEFAAGVSAWLHRHLEALQAARAKEGQPSDEPPLVLRTSRQIGNHVNHLVRRLRPKDSDERFRKGFERRGVHTGSTGDGLGQLTLSHDTVSLKAVDYRLLLIAKEMRREGDARTLEQLRADLAVDLLLGRLTVGSSTGEFEEPETSQTGRPLDTVQQWPTQRWARPVINVTVPMQTLMGLSDAPGTLSGDEPIPAALVRMLAQDPDSTWYRMLTDPARECVELSTHSYRPTGPIWRQMVADASSCLGPVCTRAATESEADHRVPFPQGPTSTENLGPACRTHHKGKHAPGFGLARGPDGRLAFTTRAGFAHPVERFEQPVETRWGRDAMWEFEFSPAEVRDALLYLAHERRQAREARALRREVEQQKADFRASYPDATEDEIHGWVHDDDPQAPVPPPLLRQGERLGTVLAREAAAA